MNSKGLVFVSCLAAGALMASPAMGKPTKKSSVSKSNRTAPQTTQVTRNQRYTQNISPRTGSTRYYGGTRYSGTRSYAGRQYTGTRYYGGTGYYGNYYGGTPYYYGGGWGSSSVWPYVAASAASSLWAPGYSRYPYSYDGGYPYNYSYYGSYPNNYSYYGSGYGYGYAGSTVAAVQRRLGQLGYYHGVVDGVIGPQTRGAIAAFESRNGLLVDGRINRPLLNRLGLA
jgi:Putative peptidoglycan binding domain